MMQFKLMVGNKHFIVECTGAEMEAFLGLTSKMISGSPEYINAETVFVRDFHSAPVVQEVDLVYPSTAVIFDDEYDARREGRPIPD